MSKFHKPYMKNSVQYALDRLKVVNRIYHEEVESSEEWWKASNERDVLLTFLEYKGYLGEFWGWSKDLKDYGTKYYEE